MKKQLLIFTVAALTLVTSIQAFAESIADTPDNRQQQAQRYLQVTPPKALFEDMGKKMAMNLPPAERDKFIQLFTSQLDIDALKKAMTDAIVKHFTAEEIKALADFYGSPVGKSAMSKFGDYMADLMPVIQAEVMKAQAKANQSTPNK
jgi:hypothetical protein